MVGRGAAQIANGGTVGDSLSGYAVCESNTWTVATLLIFSSVLRALAAVASARGVPEESEPQDTRWQQSALRMAHSAPRMGGLQRD